MITKFGLTNAKTKTVASIHKRTPTQWQTPATSNTIAPLIRGWDNRGMMMEKYINEHGKECWRRVDLLSPFTSSMFHEVNMTYRSDIYENTDYQWALHTNLGSITVLDRLTGFSCGLRDTETGYRDTEGNFWLASGMYDVRESDAITIGDAIDWIKQRANTCAPTN